MALRNQSFARTIVRVTYSKQMDRVRIIFDDRTIYVVPRRLIEGLELAGGEQLRRIEIDGTEIEWPLLGVKHSVPRLLNGEYGSRRWMAALERVPAETGRGKAMFVSERRKASARMRQFFDERLVIASAQARGEKGRPA